MGYFCTSSRGEQENARGRMKRENSRGETHEENGKYGTSVRADIAGHDGSELGEGGGAGEGVEEQ
jgi:hypothetical protein